MIANPGKTTDYLNHVSVLIFVISVKFPHSITPLSPRFNLNLALSRGRMFTRHTRNAASERLSVYWTSLMASSLWAGTMLSGICVRLGDALQFSSFGKRHIHEILTFSSVQ